MPKDISIIDGVYPVIDKFVLRHSGKDDYDEESFNREFVQLLSDFTKFRNEAGVSNVKKGFKVKENRELFSIALQPYICFEAVAINEKLFPEQLSQKYNPYKSAVHHFKYNGLVSFKDGYSSDGNIPDDKDKFGLTMINAFDETEKNLWIDTLFRGFKIFFNKFFNMKVILFNWGYHRLPNYIELAIDLTDKYCKSITSSDNEHIKTLLNSQISDIIEDQHPGKINYHDNWTFFRYSIFALDDMLKSNNLLC